MAKDTLYVLTPGFSDKGNTWFCPFSAQVIGFLAYYPQIKDSLDIVELDFPKPRHPLFDVLGVEHQGAPMLVLGGEPTPVPNVHVQIANGHHYVEKTMEIMRYLAATRSVPGPH